MSEFSIDWLDLRESSDEKARDPKLLKLVSDSIERAGAAVVVDLGAGTGSMLRALKKRDAQVALWRLVDHNGKSLDEALKRHMADELMEDHQADLTVIDELPLIGATVVTASALFDLASTDFVDGLIARLQKQNSLIYAPLNYNGQVLWNPKHPLDEAVLEAFNEDQKRDKGMGPALGPAASDYLADALEQAGYEVAQAPSPWQLGSADTALMTQLAQGVAQAITRSTELSGEQIEQWLNFRLENMKHGQCDVGHTDVLAIPKALA
ncbi:MAG: class I SAM-dependent methyltransferase [Pseudohongiellaceae bacterium]|nr:class I SAM-dependent methyltransferase [Pseudohongiellaceae bacterium]